MKSERWKQIDELFQAALEREPGQRTVFLEQACAGNETLRKEVESLLAADEQAGRFIEKPAVEVAAALLAGGQHAQSLVGRVIGAYRIIAPLRAGGMGEVYLAEDQRLCRKVAIKFLSPGSIADVRARKRLIREAQATAKLDHPNICAIYEVGEEADRSFIIMQYVEGETLADKILRQPLELSEALDVAAQAADALAEAHSRGIIHRDIKPQNIMITPRGQVKILDFGLAKAVQGRSSAGSEPTTESQLTMAGVLAGTVPYMSPEQVQGKPVDARSDVFSLGVVLYEMLTGKQPFAAENTATTISAILTREPLPLARYVGEVPAELERIVTKALRKDMEERYQTAKDFQIDLESLKREAKFESKTKRSTRASLNDKKTFESGESQATVQANRQPAIPQGDLPATQIISRKGHLLRWLVRHKPALAGVAVILLAFVGGRVYFIGHSKAIESIAVLPFVNVSGNPNAEYLSDGITESLINSLSELPHLKVMSRTSVFRYKGRETDAQAAGSELKVQAVLMGRVVQHGDELSISIELVDTRDNSHLWGEHYNRKLSDILVVQGEISQKISAKLRLKLEGEEEKLLTKRHTENTEAYQLYLMGRYYWNKRTPESLKKGIEYFQQAIDLDPKYALAYAGLADSYSLLGDYGALPPREVYPKAEAAAARALRIDDQLAEAHTSLAHARLFEWDWSGAEREYKRAIELKPNYATAHQWYANSLIAVGRFTEALTETKRAMEIDPLSLIINEVAGRHLYLAGQYEEAIEQQHQTLELDSNFIPAHAALGMAYVQKAMYEQAIAEFQKAIDLSGGNPDYIAELGHAYAASGERIKAQKVLDELKVLSKRRYVSPYSIARVCASLGEKDQAFAWLRKAYAEGNSELIFVKVEPVFKVIRSDWRFAELLKLVGLPP